jgi:SAM-dependent methyltransferase
MPNENKKTPRHFSGPTPNSKQWAAAILVFVTLSRAGLATTGGDLPPGLVSDTVNQRGWIFTQVVDPISQAYVQYATHDPYSTLEIGFGGGATAAELLKGQLGQLNDRDEHSIYLNDLSNDVIAHAMQVHPELNHPRVIPLAGIFPDEIEFPHQSLGSVLASRVFHYLTPEQWRVGINQIFKWLRPGGKLFITTGSYFIRNQADRIPSILDKKARGTEWPAYYETAREAYGSGAGKGVANLVDEEILLRELKRAGFTVEKFSYLDARKILPASFVLNGREGVGAIATKPE